MTDERLIVMLIGLLLLVVFLTILIQRIMGITYT